MSSNFSCSYMARSSWTYIPGFSAKFFFQPINTDYANKAYFDKRLHLNLLLWNRWIKLHQTWQMGVFWCVVLHFGISLFVFICFYFIFACLYICVFLYGVCFNVCLFACLFCCLISFLFPFWIYLLFMLCDCTLSIFLWKYILL
jgi:hypothetical protein